jgi:hypothetical protein
LPAPVHGRCLSPLLRAPHPDCVDQQEQGADTFVLVSPKGEKKTYANLKVCLAEGMRMLTVHGPLPASRLRTEKKEETKDAAPPEASDPEQVKEKCDALGGERSKKRRACRAMIDACENATELPIRLKTTRGSFKAESKEACVDLSISLARRSAQLGSAEPEQAEEEAEEKAPRKKARRAEPTPEIPPAIIKPFSELALPLRVTGEDREESRTLMLGGGKGMRIRLQYSVKRIKGRARYLMTYSVFRGKEQLADEQTLKFSAPGRKLNLAFEIVPSKEGDFSELQSFKIVEMK